MEYSSSSSNVSLVSSDESPELSVSSAWDSSSSGIWFLLLGSTALKRFAFSRNLPEVFGAALGIYSSGEPSGLSEDEFTGNGLVAMRTFHSSSLIA